jgi:hypothetical protein
MPPVGFEPTISAGERPNGHYQRLNYYIIEEHNGTAPIIVKYELYLTIFIDLCKKNAYFAIRTQCNFILPTQIEGFYSFKDVKISQCE